MTQSDMKGAPYQPGIESNNMLEKEQREQHESTYGISAHSDLPVFDKAEEKKIIRKMDLRIIPMVTTLYLLSFIDRG